MKTTIIATLLVLLAIAVLEPRPVPGKSIVAKRDKTMEQHEREWRTGWERAWK